MVKRRQTISELRWPDTDEFMAISKHWCETASTNILTFVWEGYDLLVKEVLSEIDCSQAKDDIERDITQLLEPEIRKVMTGDEPYYVQHGSYERETRQPAPAQPKEYDIAFILSANRRIIWPLEAKVLKTDGDVGEYIKEINENFIPCLYAPFSYQGGMLGYLFSGDSNKAFTNIATKVPCTLSDHPNFLNRDHKTSDHQRIVPAEKEKSYPAEFCCHHLLLKIIASVPTNTSSV
ncbi:hypothetical protein QUB19_02225 [Microcoleus sp. B4-C5]|uniref:hypothetical protein n=1 Tax=unclassified Microcoleus TaxID=2642155 RepID=UPI002FD28016